MQLAGVLRAGGALRQQSKLNHIPQAVQDQPGLENRTLKSDPPTPSLPQNGRAVREGVFDEETDMGVVVSRTNTHTTEQQQAATELAAVITERQYPATGTI